MSCSSLDILYIQSGPHIETLAHSRRTQIFKRAQMLETYTDCAYDCASLLQCYCLEMYSDQFLLSR